MKRLDETPETIEIKGKKICVLSWFNHERVNDLYEIQKKVFKKFDMKINHYFDPNMTHAKFMDYSLLNFDADIFIFFDLDCIPVMEGLYEMIVDEHLKNDCVIGIEQSSQHFTPNFIYAGPACFSISKKVYNLLGNISFDGIMFRSDVAEEISYACIKNQIPLKFFELVSSKNNKWKLGDDRFFGNGCYYKMNEKLIYHQFQTNLDEQKRDFENECINLINNL